MRFTPLLFALAVTHVAAQTWFSPDGMSGKDLHVAVDMDSLNTSIRRGDALRRAWLLSDYALPQHDDGKPYRSVKTLWLVDCRLGRMGATQSIHYAAPYGAGDVVASYSTPDAAVNLTEPAPGTIGEGVRDFVCSVQVDMTTR